MWEDINLEEMPCVRARYYCPLALMRLIRNALCSVLTGPMRSHTDIRRFCSVALVVSAPPGQAGLVSLCLRDAAFLHGEAWWQLCTEPVHSCLSSTSVGSLHVSL